MYTTETCGACHLIKQYLEKLENIKWEEIMLSDQTRHLFQENNITSAPTLLFIEESGTIKERKEGFLPEEQFLQIYKK